MRGMKLFHLLVCAGCILFILWCLFTLSGCASIQDAQTCRRAGEIGCADHRPTSATLYNELKAQGAIQ